MPALAKAIRRHRESVRTQRAIMTALAAASTPSMRDEIVLVAQRGGVFHR